MPSAATTGTILRSETSDIALVYPILQPLTAKLRVVEAPPLLSANAVAVTAKQIYDQNTSYDVLLSGATDSYMVSTTYSQEPTTTAAVPSARTKRTDSVTRERSETNASTVSTATAKTNTKAPTHVPWGKNEGFVKLTLQVRVALSSSLIYLLTGDSLSLVSQYDNTKVPLGFNIITDDPLPNEYIRVPIKVLYILSLLHP